MFNKEFFPTPKEVIQKMLEPYFIPEPDEDEDPQAYRKYRYRREHSRMNYLTILEPSAGKGDILQYIQEEFLYNRRSVDFYCMEIEPELQHILRGENYKVIGSDFLTYAGDYYFDLIIMNPPFSNGDQHLLKAWEILRNGDIICLLNAETIRNPHTERRKLIAKIIEDNNGIVEYIGQAFKDAERPTDVEVCIVRLHKEKAPDDQMNFQFSNGSKEKHATLSENILKDAPALRDVVGNMMLQYQQAKDYYVKYLEAIEGLKFYSKPLVTEYFDEKKILQFEGNKQKSYNSFCDTMKSEIWRVVVQHLNIQKYMTHKVSQNFEEFCRHQGFLDFTKENVFDLVNMIFENRYNILDKAIVEVFDVFTAYHSENRLHVEGWKTNDAWKVNRKIILPHWVAYGEYCDANSLKRYGDTFKMNYSRSSQYSDIDKVMCYITGQQYETCYTIYDSLNNRFRRLDRVKTGDKFDNEGESQFFKWKFWKKGTLHIEFKDAKLWEEFNIRACLGKNWLPDAEKKKYEQEKQQEQQKKEAATAGNFGSPQLLLAI